eukprot:COSAG06_NODE_57_length_27525_cov_14.855279_25_plen_109_part_00
MVVVGAWWQVSLDASPSVCLSAWACACAVLCCAVLCCAVLCCAVQVGVLRILPSLGRTATTTGMFCSTWSRPQERHGRDLVAMHSRENDHHPDRLAQWLGAELGTRVI